MTTQTGSTRRDFLKTSALATGGLVVAFHVPGTGRMAALRSAVARPFAPNAFLRIGTDDTITVLLAHSEMGQGIWTALPMLIAEELDADWSTIRVEHAPAAPEYGHLGFGIQVTGGSTSVRSEFERYRQAGATARALLVDAAAERFGVSPSECRTENGVVIAGAHTASFGELAEAAAELTPPDEVPLKDPTEWTVIGKPTLRLDTPEKITGRAQFGLDVQFEDLLTAVVARSPVLGGTVESFDATAAMEVPGVRQVVQVPTGVAVVADHFWAAKLGREALEVEWDLGPNAELDSKTIRSRLRALAGTPGTPAARDGDVAAGLSSATQILEAEYFVPYLAHAPMEPLNCTVRIGPDKCEIWTGAQAQGMDQAVAAAITGLEPEQVELHTTFLGGSFGRRATFDSDYVAEAVLVAMTAGVPVKTVWMRDEDIRGGYYRPAFVHRVRVGLGRDGLPVAWDHVMAGQSVLSGTPLDGFIENGIDPMSVEGVADSTYLSDIPNYRVALHSPSFGIPVQWWRSVGHSHTAFVIETMIDEVAHTAGRDPVEFRRVLLADQPRDLGVLDLAASKAGWGSELPAGRARGVAVHESFGSHMAQIAEVSIEDGAIRVHRVVCAIDCGIAVNPETIASQVEGGVGFGLGAALYSGLHIKQGRVQESNFHDYRVLRLDEMPEVETHIVPSSEPPGGIGEVPVPPIAPAVANAVFALTGMRHRELPLVLKS